jgi:hypothetical protein
MSEPLIEGGKLVRLWNGRLGAEGVPGAKRGLLVHSASTHRVSGGHASGVYVLTKRVMRGSDLWYARRAYESIERVVE